MMHSPVSRVTLDAKCFHMHGGFLSLIPQASGVRGGVLPLYMHPFCSSFYVNDENNPAYEETRDTFLHESRRAILIGAPLAELQEYAEWLRSLEPQGPRILFLTRQYNPEPVWPKQLARGIQEVFDPRKIVIRGAELSLDDGVPNYGCVYGTQAFLEDLESEIEPEHCWLTNYEI